MKFLWRRDKRYDLLFLRSNHYTSKVHHLSSKPARLNGFPNSNGLTGEEAKRLGERIAQESKNLGKQATKEHLDEFTERYIKSLKIEKHLKSIYTGLSPRDAELFAIRSVNSGNMSAHNLEVCKKNAINSIERDKEKGRLPGVFRLDSPRDIAKFLEFKYIGISPDQKNKLSEKFYKDIGGLDGVDARQNYIENQMELTMGENKNIKKKVDLNAAHSAHMRRPSLPKIPFKN